MEIHDYNTFSERTGDLISSVKALNGTIIS